MDVKFFLFVLILFSKSSSAERLRGSETKPQDVVQKLIESAGYENEVHQIETEDGYLLKVHRIKARGNRTRIGPVFFLHGLFATAADYIVIGPEIALHNGYDIWLGNTRGNDHSHDHKTLSSTSKEYWNFSWHEIGYYDIPAMIDYVLEQTNSSGVYYVGHSQGTTTFTVMLATRPEYNRKIIQSHLLAPAVFMKNFPHLVKHVYNEYLVKFFGGPEGYIDVSGNSSLAFVELTANFFCQGQTPIMGFCEALMVSVCGMNVNGVQCDPRILPTLMSHLSHYASIKQAIHFMQNYQNGGFRQFDHQGDNMKIYGSASPPSYNLKNIKAPTYIYSGSCDILVSEQDVKRLKNALANVRELKSFKNYNHCDFNYGKNSRAVYQNDMLKAMNSAKN